ncbi:MAG: vanadium-dependent haloperoxidase, partial [Gemmataceae bacterium]
WEWKYRYRLWRPITAIRQVDSDWSSLLETPPFPSYTSGHSTFSGAAATILTQLLGKEGVEFAIGSDGYPGMERSFKTFWEAAEEAGKSRIYGGIHFACDNRAGLNLGKEIADSVMRSRLLPLVQDPTRPDRATSGDIPAPRRIPRGPEN